MELRVIRSFRFNTDRRKGYRTSLFQVLFQVIIRHNSYNNSVRYNIQNHILFCWRVTTLKLMTEGKAFHLSTVLPHNWHVN